MRVYGSLNEVLAAPGRERVVAIGVFDGVHRGHKRILTWTVEIAREHGVLSAAMTFYPDPEEVLHPKSAPRILTTLERKADLIRSLGLDELVVVRFDREFARLSPEAFCRLVLSDKLGARMVLVGQNFHFGHKGAGSATDLRKFGVAHDFEVLPVSLAMEEGEAVSSTRIRRLISSGHVVEAARLLGRPHRLEGTVVKGAGRGRSLDAPTANLEVAAGMALPAAGVYVTWSYLDGSSAGPSVTSLGTNPTFEVGGDIRVETLLLEQEGDFYGLKLEVDLLERIRGQCTFPSASSLAARIRRDVEFARGYFEIIGGSGVEGADWSRVSYSKSLR
jgi:riboflavin kinase/FMN adenylyltransferase